jgi:hypothetical protein
MPKTKKKAKGATRPSDYFPDIDEWPNDWIGTKEDLEIGRGFLGVAWVQMSCGKERV